MASDDFPQDPFAPYASRPMTGPRDEDVVSIGALVTALYDILSGPAGPRDWDRERHLYAPRATLSAMRVGEEGTAEDGAIRIESMDVEEFIASRSTFLTAQDFIERELGQRVERFGNYAHVWSAYEGIGGPPGGPHGVMFRGVNSLQVQWDGARWWIVSVVWDRERPDNPLPAELIAGNA